MSDERYEIRSKLGEGGVGAVYRAFDTQLNREVAIKRVLADGGYENQAEATEQLLKEATALSSVQHPHIVTVYDAGVDSDGPYVVMELIEGKTLDEMVGRGILTWNDLREIALQSQEALIAAQDLNLVHRDLKPSNLMVCWLPSGKFQVKIVDFGLAKFSATPSLQTIDHGDAVFGSIFFMAPEQFERIPLDQRTDMYAMGCLYYYALTGEHPFNGETAASVMASHLQHYVTPLHEVRPDIPQWAADWIMWHMERNMDDRPLDARAALERFLQLDKQATQAVNVNAVSGATSGQPQFNFPSSADTQAPATTAPQATPEVILQTAPQPIASPSDETGKASPHTQAQKIAQESTAAQQIATQATAQQTANTNGQPAPTSAPHRELEPSPTTPLSPTPLAAAADTTTGISPKIKWTVIIILTLILVASAVIGNSILSSRNQAKIVNDLLTEAKALDDQAELQAGIQVDAEQLEGVLNRATSVLDDKQRPILLKVLAFAKPKSSDLNIDQKIIAHVSSAQCPENIRTEIFKAVMSRRTNSANVRPLLEYAKNSTEESAATAAVTAAHRSAIGQPAIKYIGSFLDIISSSESKSVRDAAERATTDLISQSNNKQQFGASILVAYEEALSPASKYAMLRLCGITGGSTTSKIVNAALNSSDGALKTAALTALSQWPTDSEFLTLTQFISTTSNDSLRRHAFDAAFSFLRIHNKNESIDHEKLWTTLNSAVNGRREKLLIIGGMVNQTEEWAIKILDTYLKDEDNKVLDQAERAQSRILKQLEKK